MIQYGFPSNKMGIIKIPYSILGDNTVYQESINKIFNVFTPVEINRETDKEIIYIGYCELFEELGDGDLVKEYFPLIKGNWIEMKEVKKK